MKTRIREIRKRRGLTIQKAAGLAGMSQSYLSEIETGRKNANTNHLEKIAKVLGVPPGTLLDTSGGDEIESEIISLLRCATFEQKQILLKVAKFLLS